MPALTGTPYQELLDAIASYYGSGSDPWLEVAKYGSSADDFVEIVNQLPGYEVVTNKAGDVITYQKIGSFPTTNPATVVDSNVINPPVKVTTPATVGTDVTTGDVIASKGITTPNAFQFITKSVVPAIVASGVAITLGKTIDKALYEANPYFWDSIGMSTLDPDTWDTITADMSGSTGERALATAFNLLYGIDPATNKSQAYIDQNALAYLALYMQTMGVFTESQHVLPDQTALFHPNNYVNVNMAQGATSGSYYPNKTYDPDTIWTFDFNTLSSSDIYTGMVCFEDSGRLYYHPAAYSESPFTGVYSRRYPSGAEVDSVSFSGTAVTRNDKTYYVWYHSGGISDIVSISGGSAQFLDVYNTNQIVWDLAYIMDNGEEVGPPEGIGDQTGATLPNLDGIATVAAMLAALQTQYPDLFNNAIQYPVLQPNGEEITYTYIPIALPDATSATDTQPTADGETITQQEPAYDPATMPEEIWEAIWDILMPTPTEEDTPTDTTGEGDTPTIVPPVGTASALWKIYNPSQSQLDDFGAWLWSSDFVDQLLKVFSDPMQAIIGLHKIFVTPPTSGSGPIKVGYLVSDASANYVSGQYVDVSCGSVTLSEYFHNVFDYENTQVSIYLPFSGIHKLDVDDVMRGEISVIYHVDVLTGACLIDVGVKRDMVGGVLYTFNGNCAVQYPVSSGSYVGIVTGLLGIVGGVAGTIATGGALAPMLMGAGASVGHMHTDVQHSGNISANAGAMGAKKPYLIIERPQIKTPPTGAIIEGLPQNDVVQLSSLSGFVKIKTAQYDGIPATYQELEQIQMLLTNGIYIK